MLVPRKHPRIIRLPGRASVPRGASVTLDARRGPRDRDSGPPPQSVPLLPFDYSVSAEHINQLRLNTFHCSFPNVSV